MNRKLHPDLSWLSILLTALILAACSSRPRLVASYPSQERPVVPAPSPRLPLESQIVYDAYIDMEVSNPVNAAQRAEDLAGDYGGYLVSSQSWKDDNRRHTSLVLAVPAPNFEALRKKILNLGSLQSEQVSGRWSSSYDVDWSVYSQITVTFHPKALALPDFPSTGWNPGRTFENALQVFLKIFGFMADILIWALVVGGPFVIIALGLRFLLRRAHLIK